MDDIGLVLTFDENSLLYQLKDNKLEPGQGNYFNLKIIGFDL